jgi:peptide/nickel transport system permease protein
MSEALKQTGAPESPFRRFAVSYAENRVAVGALFVFLVITLLALLSPWITPQNPYDLAQINIIDGRLRPGTKGMSDVTYWLGTDDQGRDILSGIFYGLRISLGVGVISNLFALFIGLVLGLVAAYFRGKIGSLLMRIVDLQLSFPPILIALIFLAVLGRGTEKVILALIVTQWARYARIVYASGLSEREKEYMEAAKCLALSQPRIIFRHLLPNCLPPLIVVGSVNVAFSIALEATLSFLGVGLPITEPSLGLLIANGYQYILSGLYWISFFPGVALLITVGSLNLVTDQLRDVLNPRLQR